ncbi:rhodanese-like domain-containing protein [Denitrificimonas caeni]|jgi:rhodanese-related sulfurtransferase|uniref:rhodanese-like domain-containing protein n=1 Tax=Denitrificimonas caeni TaxID=521720 RepID=UPI0003B5DB96|nr:rhodanese-like domain-containing protein [Denitrificimonas caeni]|tara:strand:+ start:967 stop:1311 length:345 start_codon:yes stop_codon:yes gene_type:complete
MKLFDWLPFGRVKEISSEDLLDKLESVQIVDVRTSAEFKLSHIQGAVNLPITNFSESAIDGLSLEREVPIVTICLSAHRSIPATRRLKQLGYDVKQLQGGMKSWWHKGYPTVKR